MRGKKLRRSGRQISNGRRGQKEDLRIEIQSCEIRDNSLKSIAKSYKTQNNMFNINTAVQTRSLASKIFSTKIGFTVHRSHFDGRLSPPALSRGFNKSRESFPSYPSTAAESRGIKELSEAPVNLGLLRGAASWSHGHLALNGIRILSKATTGFVLSSVLPGDSAVFLYLFSDALNSVK